MLESIAGVPGVCLLVFGVERREGGCMSPTLMADPRCAGVLFCVGVCAPSDRIGVLTLRAGVCCRPAELRLFFFLGDLEGAISMKANQNRAKLIFEKIRGTKISKKTGQNSL